MSTHDEINNLRSAYNQLNKKANSLYKFCSLYNDYMSTPKDYGTGQKISMIEVHMLTYIEENPYITASQLSIDLQKTKGAISQTIKKLIAQNLVLREYKENNNKTMFLSVTSKGKELSIAHKMYDLVNISKTTEELLLECTPDELDVFYKVIGIYISLLQ